MNEIKRLFVTGLITIIPIAITIFIFYFFISYLGSFFRPILASHPILHRLPMPLLSVFGFVLFLVIIIAVGGLTEGLVGRWFLRLIDDALARIPLVRGIYSSARQFTQSIFVDKKSLRKTVLAEYPRKGCYTIGFLMVEDKIDLGNNRKGLFIFFPATPNPTTGWLALIPEEEVIETDLPIEQGLKLVVSGGIVLPETIKNWQIKDKKFSKGST
ncbi:MAG: DUF502 domain-containing protein [candidate division WOR-3 bacterium]